VVGLNIPILFHVLSPILLMALPWLSHSIAISASWRLFVHVFTWMD